MYVLRIIIGNGEDTFFWWDPWTPFGSLIHFLGQEGPANLGIHLFSLVKDVLFPACWCLPPARSDLQLQLFSYITTIDYTPTSDKPVWMIEDRTYNHFSSKDVRMAIRPTRPSVPWSSLVWHKVAIPKDATNTWLFILNRNPTLDRLLQGGLYVTMFALRQLS